MKAVWCYAVMGITEKIVAEIERQGTSQSRVARKAGLGVTMVSNVLSGRQRLYVDQAMRLARALGVSLDYLADDARSASDTDPTAAERAIIATVRARGLTLEEAVKRLTADPTAAGPDPGRRPAAPREAVHGHPVDPVTGERLDGPRRKGKAG